MTQIHGSIPRRLGAAVVISSTRHKGQARLDLREHFLPTGQDTLVPTRRGISLPISDIPALRRALQAAEADAVAAGLLPNPQH